MRHESCTICQADGYLVRFFTEVVCLTCSEGLKKINKNELCWNRDIVIFYIKIYAQFLYKGNCLPDSDLLNILMLDQLNKLAHWIHKMTRTNF